MADDFAEAVRLAAADMRRNLRLPDDEVLTVVPPAGLIGPARKALAGDPTSIVSDERDQEMTDGTGWFADLSDNVEATAIGPWRPFLQAAGGCFPLPIWFASKDECEKFIGEHIAKTGWLDPPRSDAWNSVCHKAYENLTTDTSVSLDDIERVLVTGAREMAAVDWSTAEGATSGERLLDRVAETTGVCRLDVDAVLAWCADDAAYLLANARNPIDVNPT